MNRPGTGHALRFHSAPLAESAEMTMGFAPWCHLCTYNGKQLNAYYIEGCTDMTHGRVTSTKEALSRARASRSFVVCSSLF